ncbi:MAG: nuclear transport factor 2 family protein [Pseudomonadota bacterium]
MIRALLIVLACGMAPAHAQNGAPNPAHGPDGGAATRSVAKYLTLERRLLAAIGAHDSGALSAIVDPDFELRSPAAQDTESRADWLKGVSGRPAQLRALAVKEADGLAMVSFLLDTQGPQRQRQTYFVVDAWRQSSGTLQARYISAAVSAPPPARKPDGRE